MKPHDVRITAIMRGQLSLVTLPQALAAGLTRTQVQARVRSGLWLRLHAGVYASAGASPSPARDLLGACLAAGPPSAATHLSAAWMHQLIRNPPRRPVITIPYERNVELRGVVVHRSRDLDPGRLLHRNGIPYTDPLRVLTDLAAELPVNQLLPVVDRALSSGLVTTEGIVAEVARRKKQGRKGPGRLMHLVESRGMVGGPEPSVLEAEAMRLFRRWGIPIRGREVRAGSDGRYRIDFQIAPGLAVEVDGFVHHWSPEAKAYDDTRRNRLQATGMTVLVYDWRSIRLEGRRVAEEIRAAMARLGPDARSLRDRPGAAT